MATALKVFRGECFFATDFGVDWWRLLGGRSAEAVVLQCRGVIATRPGITRINRVTAGLNPNTRRLRVNYDVTSKFSLRTANSVQIAS